MMRLARVIAAASAAVLVAAVLTGTAGAASNDTKGAETAKTAKTAKSAKGSTSSTPKVKVKVGDNFFDPEEVEVSAGTKVVWKNTGRVLHNVQPAKGDAWGTKSLTRGKKYVHRFTKPGRYAYYCSFHGSPTGGQRGVIVVTPAAETPATTTTTPAG